MNDYNTPIEATEVTTTASPIVKLTGFIAMLVFAANEILLLALISTVLAYGPLQSSQPIGVQVILIFVVYLFAIVLFIYSRQAYSDLFDAIVYAVFGWTYVLLGACFLAVAARRFVVSFDFDLGFTNFAIYGVAVIVISSFGVVIARIVNEKVRYFSVPFLLVAMWEVGLWVWRVLSSSGTPVGWNLLGSLFLFVFTLAFTMFLLRKSDTSAEEQTDELW